MSILKMNRCEPVRAELKLTKTGFETGHSTEILSQVNLLDEGLLEVLSTIYDKFYHIGPIVDKTL